MSERVLQGPFLTRAQAGRRAGIPGPVLVHRRDLLSLGSPWIQEAYFAFQFDEHGVRPDIGSVVLHLRGPFSDVDIADWLVRPNPSLADARPLEVLDSGAPHALRHVLDAADAHGPVAEDLWSTVIDPPGAPGSVAVPPPPSPVPTSVERRDRPHPRRRLRAPAPTA